MALSSGYVLRETGGNLRRNLVMTIAAVITMVVSLSALGGVLIMRQAINAQSIQWRGGVSIAVFLNPNVTPAQTRSIGQVIATTPGVKSEHFVDKDRAYQEMRTMFGPSSPLVRVESPQLAPPSYRVVPVRPAVIPELGAVFNHQPGVSNVAYARAAIDALQARFRVLKYIALALAIGVMIGAVALIVNTIQLAIFARRREVAVMKLVGATNWFIRVPFMLEGLVHGLLGAALAFLAVYFARNTIASFIGSESVLVNHTAYVSTGDAVMTGLLIVVVGAVVGVVGSAFAVRRFLRV